MEMLFLCVIKEIKFWIFLDDVICDLLSNIIVYIVHFWNLEARKSNKIPFISCE